MENWIEKRKSLNDDRFFLGEFEGQTFTTRFIIALEKLLKKSIEADIAEYFLNAGK